MHEHWFAIDAGLWSVCALILSMAFDLIASGITRLKPSLTEKFITQLPAIAEKLELKIKKENE